MATGRDYTASGGTSIPAGTIDPGSIDTLAPDSLGGGISSDQFGASDPAGLEPGPSSSGTLNADGTPRKRRGRKPGGQSADSGGSPRKKPSDKDSIETLSRLLIIVHQGLSIATKSPELALTEMEADMLAKPAAAVLAQFDLKPDPRFEAVLSLVMASGFVYGPRVVLMRERLMAEAAERKARAPRNITPVSSAPPPINPGPAQNSEEDIVSAAMNLNASAAATGTFG